MWIESPSMNPRNQFRFPWVDASILLAMLFIGWAAFRLAKLEPQISGDRQLSRELPDIFNECRDLFKDSIAKPERARREFDLVWQEAAMLKADYLRIADRLQSDLPELDIALRDPSARKDRGHRQERMRELKSWIEKQMDRVSLEQLDVRSEQWMERTAGAQVSSTNGPTVMTADLGTLLKEIDRSYETYLADFREVTNNTGKPLVEAFVTQRLDGARKSFAQLSHLADQARQQSKAIELFLDSQTGSDAVARTRRQQEVIQAFLDARSPADFTRRIGNPRLAGAASTSASALKLPSLQPVRSGLLAALAGLGIFLILDV